MPNLKKFFRGHRLGGLIGAVLVFAIALSLWPSRQSEQGGKSDAWLSRDLARFSYDWSFDLTWFARSSLNGANVVIIYMDEDSYKDLHQPYNRPWDRALHAALLDRLKADGARAVVMDIVFSDPGPDPESDQKLADAIRANGRVVLAEDLNTSDVYAANQLNAAMRGPSPLFQPFESAAAAVGFAQLQPDDDFMVRQHVHFFGEGVAPSLAWVAARTAGVSLPPGSAVQQASRWVNYYGPPETVPHVSYKQAWLGDVPPGFFHDKIVFIGARPITGSFIEKRDELRNPYSTSGIDRAFVFMPMVEIHATELLNLMRGDWLVRPSPAVETAVLAVAAFVLGFGLLRFRPLAATGLAATAGLAVVLAAQSLFAMRHVWFPWLIIAGVQIPAALLWAVSYRSLEWFVQRRRLEEERRRADAQIREQAALLDKAQDAILVHDLSWRAQYWNKSAAALYGWSFEEVQSKNLKTEVFKADESKLLEALQAALGKGEWSGELKQSTKAGALLTVQSRWTLVRDDAGRPKSVLVINTDVTEQQKLEAQFLRTQRMESIGTLAGGIAHDLNNVLAPIMMAVEMMKMKPADEFTAKMLNTMGSSARRGSDMVKQVLTFARGHSGEHSVLQISHLIKEMQKIVKETFPKTIEFETCVDDIWTVLGDATQIHQIILNLCVNARDAMPAGGGIKVEARNAPLTEAEAKQFPGAQPIKYVLLSVTDTGTGIPPEIIDKIFEPFFTTKELGKGTGLGLSTVISIIKSHGGFLDLKSQVGKGTTFNVYLPAAVAAVAPASAPIAPEVLRGKGETVLVVDDEPAILDLTRTILTHYGYKVVTAIHGADALALFAQYKESVKVVIMDMMMPVMDGPAAIRALREQEPGLQFIAISGLMHGDKLKEQLGGAEISFMAKPYATENLLLNLRKLITAGPAAPRLAA